MNAYKVELLIINHDGLSEEAVKLVLENTRYGNDCISPYVMKIESADIGPWSDEHPLNNEARLNSEYKKLFNANKQP